MKNIVIVGSGGVGKEVALIIEYINNLKQTWNLIGFIDDNHEKWGQIINGYEVIGGIDVIDILPKDTLVVIAIANYKVKKNIVNRINGRLKFATIIHPDVKINNFVSLGEGSIIYEGVIITSNIKIGNHVIISPKCGIGHDSVIKDYVSLLWNVNISGNDLIEEGALMGTGSTVIQGKRVGVGATVGAGAVVVKDIDSYCTAVGIPANVIKREVINEKNIICNNC